MDCAFFGPPWTRAPGMANVVDTASVRPLAQQSRSLLDAVHGQPAVQGQAAPVRRRRGHALHHHRRPQGPGRHRRPLVRATPAMAARRSPRRSRAGRSSMDYAPAFQMGHPIAFELASRLTTCCRATSTMCSSPTPARKSVDTALKIALAYHRVKRPGPAHAPDRPRARLSRRRLRRHLGRRHRQQPQVLRPAADRRRSPAAHP